MRIAYRGNFLREGLLAAGHEIIEIPKKDSLNLDNTSADLVLLELFGNNIPLAGLSGCRQNLVAYCVDSPINEFWLRDACKLFDYVFVDQKSTLNNFGAAGINARWLPLCAQKAYFTDNTPEKIHDISFVGSIDGGRTKRCNLLRLLQGAFPLNIRSGISVGQTQQVFSQSRTILNENLFPGLTLRVFQGMAANSLVFTEESSVVANGPFRDNEHMVCFNSNNVIEKLNLVLSSYHKYEEIAHNASRVCRAAHTSETRAAELLDAIGQNDAHNLRMSDSERKWHELQARYLSILRFGGILNDIIGDFKQLAGSDSPMASKALTELGNINARNGNLSQADKYYTSSISVQDNPTAWMKMAMSRICREDFSGAKAAVARAREFFQASPDFDADNQFGEISDERGRILAGIAMMYYQQGRTFDLGFGKSYRDNVPDTAFEVASLAWDTGPHPALLDFMLRCLRPYGLEGELLPKLSAAISNGQLNDRQILQTAEIAAQYYDMTLADTIISAFKKTI